MFSSVVRLPQTPGVPTIRRNRQDNGIWWVRWPAGFHAADRERPEIVGSFPSDCADADTSGLLRIWSDCDVAHIRLMPDDHTPGQTAFAVTLHEGLLRTLPNDADSFCRAAVGVAVSWENRARRHV